MTCDQSRWRMSSPHAVAMTVAPDRRDASNALLGRTNPWRLTNNVGHRPGSAV